MPIATLQTRAREVGRIRLGTSVLRDNGKKKPIKLTAFRFTSPSEWAIGKVADLLGGTAKPWEDAGRRQFEVLTDATEIPVMVPPGQAVSQWMEQWSGGMCQRRCDGITEMLRQQPCSCPADISERAQAAAAGRACKPTTRANVIIPDFPDVGVWRLESHGYYAAVELGGAVELLDQMRQAGQIIPAVLRAEAREQRTMRNGQPETRQYVVPVLEIRATLRELTELAARPLAESLPPAPGRALAIEAAPEPQDDPRCAQDVADQVPAAGDRTVLLSLWKTGQKHGWMDEYVNVPGDDAMHTLKDVLEARAAELGLPGRTTAPGGAR